MQTLERWVDEHQPTVFRAAYLVLRDVDAAEDVAQETFLRAWHAARRPAEDQVRPWLYRIAVNQSLNKLRSVRREQRAVAATRSDESADDLAERRATRDAVAMALRTLPDRLRVPVILRYWLDLTEAEIARTLRIRPGTVKSRLHEARRTLAGDESIASAREA